MGLGNTSELKKQKVVECPEEKHYVCMKMYGGGMGDQVRRKCHLINSVSCLLVMQNVKNYEARQQVSISVVSPQEDFEELLEKEAEKERILARGDDIGADPSCYESTDKGRKVNICLCSTDMCNGASDNGAGAKLAFAAITALLALTA